MKKIIEKIENEWGMLKDYKKNHNKRWEYFKIIDLAKEYLLTWGIRYDKTNFYQIKEYDEFNYLLNILRGQIKEIPKINYDNLNNLIRTDMKKIFKERKRK